MQILLYPVFSWLYSPNPLVSPYYPDAGLKVHIDMRSFIPVCASMFVCKCSFSDSKSSKQNEELASSQRFRSYCSCACTRLQTPNPVGMLLNSIIRHSIKHCIYLLGDQVKTSTWPWCTFLVILVGRNSGWQDHNRWLTATVWEQSCALYSERKMRTKLKLMCKANLRITPVLAFPNCAGWKKDPLKISPLNLAQ